MKEPKTFWGWTFYQFHPRTYLNAIEYVPEWVAWLWKVPELLISLVFVIVAYPFVTTYRAFAPWRMYHRYKHGKKKVVDNAPKHVNCRCKLINKD